MCHINVVHIGWTPYQCLYCSQNGVVTRQPNKLLLQEHVARAHLGQPFTFLCTDDPVNRQFLKDKLRRSSTFQGTVHVSLVIEVQ